MFKNYFKTAWRNLLRNKVFSFINISGLAIGMASAILIFLWIQNEISSDRFHTNISKLYEVWGNDVYNGEVKSGKATPEIMAPVLKNDVPEIDKVSRISWGEDYLFTVGDKSLKAHGNIVDPDFLSMFSFPIVEGNVNALNDPHSVVLTQKLARDIFGNEDPIGKTITIQRGTDYKVTAVLRDLPSNTEFKFDYLLSYVYKSTTGDIDSDWTDVSIRTFVMLKPNTSFNAANAKIKNVIAQHSGNRSKTTSFLYPVSKLRLYSDFKNGKPVGGLIERVRIFSLIAILILLIACINFMNLSTAGSEKRAREVGIRKVVGAGRKILINQFLAESIVVAFISGVLAIIIVQLCLPAFNNLVQKQLFINYSSIYSWGTAIGFILFTGILAGSYPAFFLSAFKPITVLKGTFKKINASVTPRKLLVVLQFTFAIALIICTIIIAQQIKYAQQRETGYNKDKLG
ncbi:MAG: ABC transporter permease, partial [Ginsengibacter sp.]